MEALEQYLSQPLLDVYEPLAMLHQGAVRQTLLLQKRGGDEQRVLKRSAEVDQLRNEARFLTELAGEGIPGEISFFDDGAYGYLLREYIPGETLLDYVQKRGCLSAEETARIGISICRILNRLHSRALPVIHRDIKAENVIRSPDGSLYLIDFGTARYYVSGARQDTTVLGTPSVAPPEQFGFRQTDPRSDIYSVGCLLHTLATGETELDRGRAAPPLQKIIQKCVRFDPEQRYASASALEQALRLLTVQRRRLSIGAAFGALLLVALALIGILTLRSNHAQTRPPETEPSASAQSEAPTETEVPTETQRASAVSAYTSGDGLYHFASPEIEKEVCRQLGREPGPVPEAELSKIKTLIICGAWYFTDTEGFCTHGKEVTLPYFGVISTSVNGGINTLVDIPHLPNLKQLMLCRQQISDLSPLEDCGVEWLALHGNWISDISPLASCTRLRELWIGDNPVSDLSPLASLSGLQNLHIDATPVTDLSPLTALPQLHILDLFDCPMDADLTPLLDAPELFYLTVYPLDDARLRLLCSFTGLTHLNLWLPLTQSDLRELAPLSKLKYLFVDLNIADSCEGIQALTQLKWLALASDEVVDLHPLTALKKLERLDVNELVVEDWSPLLELPKLRVIHCSQSQYDALCSLFSDSEVELEVVS